ncbi:molybdopterin-dependent oxidoreductase [Myxococcota bacterium]|nr:molybdopterin-dependent oxidoreductase [Myxococcota bacterium]
MTRREITTVVRRRFSRRDVLKLAQLGGLGAGAAALGLLGRASTAEATTKGTCRFCSMHCGIVATHRGGQLVRIDGDLDAPSKGFVCIHGQALREVIHAKERLTAPLVRRGDVFEETTWPEALAELATRLHAVREKTGPESIALQVGWPFVRHPLVPFFHRFTRALGSPNFATAASFCAIAGRLGRTLTAGADFLPDVGRQTRTAFVWGSNPANTSPPFHHALARLARKGNNLVVVDPIKTELAERATLFLQVCPGSDGALALGMMHVMLREGWLDRARIDATTVGFDALLPVIERFSPARVAEATSLGEDAITEAARIFATEGPSCVWECLGLEHHEHGTQAVRAVAVLQAVAGWVDVPGGAALSHRPGPSFFDEPLPGFFRGMTPEPVPPPVAARPIGADEHPLFEAYNRQAQSNLFARAILEGAPYPLRALMLFGANPLLTSPGTTKLRAAYESLELVVVADPFLSETARVADFVLPSATFAEGPDVDLSGRIREAPIVEPRPGAWPDWKILFELARALGLGAYFPWTSFEEAAKAPRVPWPDDGGPTLRPSAPRSSEPPRFATPSGKLELSSEILARFGLPAVPDWQPPSDAPSPERPFILVTGPRTRSYINSQFHSTPSVASKEPEPLLRLHPDAAKRAGVEDGARATVTTVAGSITLRVRVDAAVHPEIAVVPHGWASANANVLTHTDVLDRISGFPVWRSLSCRVTPAR